MDFDAFFRRAFGKADEPSLAPFDYQRRLAGTATGKPRVDYLRPLSVCTPLSRGLRSMIRIKYIKRRRAPPYVEHKHRRFPNSPHQAACSMAFSGDSVSEHILADHFGEHLAAQRATGKREGMPHGI